MNYIKKLDYKIILIIILCLISIILFSYYIYDLKYNNNINVVNKTSKKIKQKKEIIPIYNNLLPEYRINYNNNNIMGRIEIPGFLDTLIVRYTDNNYYLNRNLFNIYDGIGAPFFDFRNINLENDKQINIYGHNTQNVNILEKLPLAKLTSYLDNDIFNNNKNLYLYTDNQKVLYEIVGVKIIDKNNDTHMNIEFSNNEDFINHSNLLLDGCILRNNNKIKKDDQLLVLQTCNYNPYNSLVLVLFKKIKIIEKS